MECNKDEAHRAKTIAEKKLEDKDFAGAKKYALKAQFLYPPLEGLSQMLTTLDVYIAADNKIKDEPDWYGVLGVTGSCDDEMIKKQYRKLALMLHPDKNKSVGADGAFKIISEAWRNLSDRSKRSAYNQRRYSNGFQQRASFQSGRPSAAAPCGNGFHSAKNRAPHLKPTVHKNSAPPPTIHKNSAPPPTIHRTETDTFWTLCNRCKMHYEYPKVYLNHTLKCPNCHQAFLAAERAPPDNFFKPSNSNYEQSSQNIRNQASNNKTSKKTTSAQNVKQGESAGPKSHKHSNSHWSTSNVAGSGSTGSSVAAKVANVVQQANERLKRMREESQGSVFVGEVPLKTRIVDGNGHTYGDTFKSAGVGLQNVSGSHGFSTFNTRHNGTKELTPLETRNMLMEKTRKVVNRKLSEWALEAANKANDSNENRKIEQRKRENLKNETKCDDKLIMIGESSPAKDKAPEHLSNTSTDGMEDPVALSMNVPDPDFHDFDRDRTESSFGDSQIWAAYDDDDGMPRFYAFIHKVISRKPFKMKISWLNSKTNSEFGPLEWVDCGFSKTCGEFRVGKSEITKSLNSFSHKVKFMKGARGILQILPKKGDIWALYRNWSPDWNEHTSDEVIHKYDMVEVQDDYSEEQGLRVTPLVKVAGFKTVFHPHRDCDKVMRISKEEMFRFSHQVPHYTLTGQEAKNAPKGYLELDPAATPLELLQVLTEIEVVGGLEKVENSEGNHKVGSGKGVLKVGNGN